MFDSGHPGPVTAVMGAVSRGIVECARFDPARWSDDQARVVLGVLERVRAHVEALTIGVAAALGAEATVYARSELGVSGREARRRERVAAVAARHPVVAEALLAGRLSADHVEVLVRHGPKLPGDVVADLVAGVGAGGFDEFAERVQRATLARDGGDPDGAKRRHARRGVAFTATPAGTVRVVAELLRDEADTVRGALDHVADQRWRARHPEREHRRVEDAPSWRERQADALVDAARRILAGRYDRAGGGARPSLTVTVDLETLRSGLHTQSVCETDWGTPLSAQTVRRLACDAEIIPMVLGAPGEVLDVGRARYEPTRAQRRAVKRRDRHCTFSGCDIPPAWCQIHHIIEWHLGGRTDLANLTLLCPRHHHLVHDEGWTITGSPGNLTFHPPLAAVGISGARQDRAGP
jgi:hypothetical protein